jgi:hypothetical protein
MLFQRFAAARCHFESARAANGLVRFRAAALADRDIFMREPAAANVSGAIDGHQPG